MAGRTPLIVANWKMNTTLPDAMVLATSLHNGLEDIHGIEVVLCPPFPWLVPIAELFEKARLRHLALGAQNMFWEDDGPFTGEVSALMLKHLVSHVILGHSERVSHFNETEEITNRKLKAAFHHHLKPIVCVGETAKEGNPGHTIVTKLKKILDGIGRNRLEELAIAYEPVWAIGSGTPASGAQAELVAEAIRKEFGDHPTILYGGSVEPKNILEFLSQPEIDGALVGGASLSAHTFLKICELAVP
ncbi:MAG: triose-phosphate isomerase [Patescibacteria group bacterium]